MPKPGRSVDDLPLAAYVTGVDPGTERFPEGETEAELLAPPTAPSAAVPLPAGTLDQAVAQPGTDDDEAAAGHVATPLRRARAFARRNPRAAAGGGFVVVILVGLMLLSGGRPSPSAAGAVASPSAPPIATIAPDPGSATLVLTGSLDATYALTGVAGQPMPAKAVAATWVDTLQNVLTLDGQVDRGTRTTDAGLVLTWSLLVDGKLVTFTSEDGECTIGMAINPKYVSGTFACRKIKSDDGKYTVGATGTYRT